MIRYLLCIILAMSGYNTLFAQRLFPGQKGLEATVTFPISVFGNNFSMSDFSAGLGLTINAKNGNYKCVALEYSTRHYTYKEVKIPTETYLFEGGYSFFLLGESTRTLAVNGGMYGLLGYEMVNGDKRRLYDGAILQNQSQWVYGVAGVISVETYLTNHWVLLMQGKLQTLWGTSLERLRPSVGLGVRYMF